MHFILYTRLLLHFVKSSQCYFQIDAMVLKVDRLASSKLLALSEVQEFTSALAMMNTSLEVSDHFEGA
jgi:hypothetical protein